jgi:hypothetical protein
VSIDLMTPSSDTVRSDEVGTSPTTFVDNWLVLDILRSDGKATRGVSSTPHVPVILDSLERVEGILSKLDAWREVANQDTHRRAAKRVLQDSSQLRVSVRDARLGQIISATDNELEKDRLTAP